MVKRRLQNELTRITHPNVACFIILAKPGGGIIGGAQEDSPHPSPQAPNLSRLLFTKGPEILLGVQALRTGPS